MRPPIDVHDPATGDVVGQVPDHSPADALAALDRAASLQPSWAATPGRERGEILRRTWELMTGRSQELAELATRELGRAVKDSVAEVSYAAEFLRWNSEEAARLRGQWAPDPGGGGAQLVTVPRPIGPCLVITPWNFPLAMATRKLGPALAAGCTVIWKAATETPLSALRLLELFAEAGLPDGVVQVLTTSDPGTLTAPLLEDRRLRKLSFTGSTAVGRTLAAQAGKGLVKSSLELGGNAPFVVFDDADLDRALDDAMVAKLRNGGQSCVAANRFLLQESIYDDFSARMAERFAGLTVGAPLDGQTDVGPLVSAKQRDTTVALVRDAVDRGARVLAGGVDALDPGPAGTWLAPTVLADVPRDARCLQEELFGPVAALVSFTDEDDALTLANATDYGLAGYVHTASLERALRWAAHLEVGMLGVNRGLISNPAAPFGGLKDSGWGKEGGAEGIAEYQTLTYVALQ